MRIQQQKSHNVLIGIGLMVTAMFCYAGMNVTIGALAHDMSSTQMVFLRNVFSFIIIMVWMLARREVKECTRTKRLGQHFWRSAVGFVAMELWFYALSIMPLTTATAVSFTTPIFATIFAILLLKEQAGWRRWVAVTIGFSGVLLILRPDTQTFNYSVFIVLTSSALMALAAVVVKTLTRTEKPETIVFFMTVFMIPLSAPLAFIHWQEPTLYQLSLLFLIGLFSTVAHLLATRAYRYADMVVLLPFDFTRLVFTAVLAYLLFGEMMDQNTVIGATIILVSSLYIVHREAVRRQKHIEVDAEP